MASYLASCIAELRELTANYDTETRFYLAIDLLKDGIRNWFLVDCIPEDHIIECRKKWF